MTIKIYPSSAAFMIGPLVKTDYNSGCHRFQWAQTHSGLSKAELHHEINAESAALGTLNEYRVAVKLKKDKVKFEREVPFKIAYKGAVISGRQDFVLENGEVWETKGTGSDKVYKQSILGGVPQLNHVAQLVSYLAFLKKPKGRIVNSYYELEIDGELESYKLIAERIFIVECLDNGDLTVDGTRYDHSIRDLARWYADLEKKLADPWTLPQKPCQNGDKFGSPCFSCPLKKLCEKEVDVAQFLQESRQALLEPPPPKEFNIKVLTARRKKNRQDKKEKSNDKVPS